MTDRFFSEYCSNLHKMIKQGDIFKIHRIEIIYFEHFNFFFFFYYSYNIACLSSCHIYFALSTIYMSQAMRKRVLCHM